MDALTGDIGRSSEFWAVATAALHRAYLLYRNMNTCAMLTIVAAEMT